jgi:hypothetical protein
MILLYIATLHINVYEEMEKEVVRNLSANLGGALIDSIC